MYTYETITLTPEMAAELREKTPEHQRRTNEAYVRRISEQILADTWVHNPHPIVIDENGHLQDGQHRCAAVCLANKPITVTIVTGVPADMFGLLDIGMRRTAAQFIVGRHSSLIATATRLMMVHDDNPELIDPGLRMARMTIDQVIAGAEARPLLPVLAGEAEMTYRASRVHGATLLAVTALGFPAAEDRVSDWFTGLITGAKLEMGDPRLTLRNKFGTHYRTLNRSGNEVRRRWAYIVKSWNAFLLDESLKVLTFRPNLPGVGSGLGGASGGQPMPRILGTE